MMFTKANKKPDRKAAIGYSILKKGVNSEARNSTKALTTRENKPNVSPLSGKVNNKINGRTNKFIMEKIRLTSITVTA